ncbi:MAG: TylF/MycF/NovP-related O-methyltransferase, partial [Spirochaetota bacterium]|nr:TylF/MycF/NovP-related O-methyltransferase [Spirochaetota bacterium]
LIVAVEGDVRETVPKYAPEQLSLLRLDTDWYESTAHELRYLYSRLNPGGVLLIDDYGHFTGARQAVDEFFRGSPVFLHRDDYTGRSLVKK